MIAATPHSISPPLENYVLSRNIRGRSSLAVHPASYRCPVSSVLSNYQLKGHTAWAKS